MAKKRYDLYKLTKDNDKMRELAKWFIIEDAEFDIYLEYKNSFNNIDWAKIYSKLLDEIKEKSMSCKWGITTELYRKVLIYEKEYDRLFDEVKNKPSLILEYYKYLIPRYQSEVYELFEKTIILKSAQANDRKAYKEVCRNIKTLIKIGGTDTAYNLIDRFKKLYNRRPAFMDELSMIKF